MFVVNINDTPMVWKKVAIGLIVLEVITIVGGIQLSRYVFREEFRERQVVWEEETKQKLEDQRAEHDRDLQFIAERFNLSLNSIQGELMSTQDALDAKQDELEQIVDNDTIRYEFEGLVLPVDAEVSQIVQSGSAMRVEAGERSFAVERLGDDAQISRWEDKQSSVTIEVAGTKGYVFVGFQDQCPADCDSQYVAAQFESGGRKYRIRFPDRIEFADLDRQFLTSISVIE
jgi:hypothetical protein